MARSHDRNWGFVYFAVVGCLVAFGFVAGFSIGLPVLIAGLVLLAMPRFRRYRWPDDLGLLAGVGVVCLLVASSGVEGAAIWAGIGAALAIASTFAYSRVRMTHR